MVVAILLVMIRVLVGRRKRVRGGEVHLSNLAGWINRYHLFMKSPGLDIPENSDKSK